MCVFGSYCVDFPNFWVFLYITLHSERINISRYVYSLCTALNLVVFIFTVSLLNMNHFMLWNVQSISTLWLSYVWYGFILTLTFTMKIANILRQRRWDCVRFWSNQMLIENICITKDWFKFRTECYDKSMILLPNVYLIPHKPTAHCSTFRPITLK